MNNVVVNMDEKNTIAMKLLHYFITEKGYTPIILQGVDNEIWLENLEEDYKIVRIVMNYIHNDEQYKFDVFKTSRILKKIKAKTLSWKLNTLSIFLDLGNSVDLKERPAKNLTAIEVNEDQDIHQNEIIKTFYPDLPEKMKYQEDGMELFVKITNDINKHNQTDQQKINHVFSPKKPVVTYALILINVLAFFLPLLFGISDEIFTKFAVYGPFIKLGEYYRLLTGAFLHANFVHLFFNLYALWIVGMQLESFIGKARYLAVYLASAISASLLSILMHGNSVSVGASGAIFGLLGALVYFGYHYRVYLGNVMRSQIIPIILLNLLLGFLIPGVDNAAHIGGLIGGTLLMIGLGIPYKSNQFEKTNGIIVTILYFAFLIFMVFFFKS